MKKVISLLLALIMIFTTASAYSNDNDNISVAHAQKSAIRPLPCSSFPNRNR